MAAFLPGEGFRVAVQGRGDAGAPAVFVDAQVVYVKLPARDGTPSALMVPELAEAVACHQLAVHGNEDRLFPVLQQHQKFFMVIFQALRRKDVRPDLMVDLPHLS